MAGSGGSCPCQMAMAAPSEAICASDRSTKITPRSTTCRPRYAWMPAMIRLAAMGAARNDRIAGSIIAGSTARGGFERRRELADVEVEQRDVVGHLLVAANRRRQLEHG